MKKRKPLTNEEGEVRELLLEDIKRFRPIAEVVSPSLAAKLGVKLSEERIATLTPESGASPRPSSKKNGEIIATKVEPTAGTGRSERATRVRYTTKQMGDACEMLVAAELTLAGVPAVWLPDLWPHYDVIAELPGREPQKVSVKSRTPGKHHSRVGFDPDTCDWLAIVLFDKDGRHVFVLPKDVAEAHSSKPPRAKKRAPCALSFSKLRKAPLASYEGNFQLRRDP